MNEKQKYHLRLAGTKIQSGDIAGWTAEILKSMVAGFAGNDIKIKPATLTPAGGATLPLTPQDDSRKKEILASIYDWSKEVSTNEIPIGYKGSETVSVNADNGSVLFINDFMRKNINSFTAGIIRTQKSFLVSVNDRAGVIAPWSKHFSVVAKSDKEDTALLRNLYFILEDRAENVIPNDMNIYVFVNSLHVLEGMDRELVTELVHKGKQHGVFVIATTDAFNAKSIRGEMKNFNSVIDCDFKTSELFSVMANTTETFTPYDIVLQEIELMDTMGVTVNPNYLNLNQFIIYNALEKKVNSGMELSEPVYDILTNPDDIFAKIHNLNEDDVKRFLQFLSDANNGEIVSTFSETIDNIGELAISLGKILAGEKPEELGFVNFDIPELAIDTAIATTPRIYTDAEIDAMFHESLNDGTWKDIAKLDDEQIALTEQIMGIENDSHEDTVDNIATSTEPESPVESLDDIFIDIDNSPTVASIHSDVEITEEKEVAKPEVTPSVKNKKVEKVKDDTSEISEKERNLIIFMNATGMSREEAEGVLGD